MLVLWLCIPLSVWIKPNGNVAPINESAIIGRPVGCTISFRSRFIHFEIIGLNKPYRLGLCNKAIMNYKIKEGKFKGLGLQWLNLNYKNDIGGDYMENRIITSYTLNF
ncbi:hypothetical protein APC61_20600 [Acinetobacter baumannii]|nr:hypothetical protein APC61_20600 [Acinetobacter baumannii]